MDHIRWLIWIAYTVAVGQAAPYNHVAGVTPDGRTSKSLPLGMRDVPAERFVRPAALKTVSSLHTPVPPPEVNSAQPKSPYLSSHVRDFVPVLNAHTPLNVASDSPNPFNPAGAPAPLYSKVSLSPPTGNIFSAKSPGPSPQAPSPTDVKSFNSATGPSRLWHNLPLPEGGVAGAALYNVAKAAEPQHESASAASPEAAVSRLAAPGVPAAESVNKGISRQPQALPSTSPSAEPLLSSTGEEDEDRAAWDGMNIFQHCEGFMCFLYGFFTWWITWGQDAD